MSRTRTRDRASAASLAALCALAACGDTDEAHEAPTFADERPLTLSDFFAAGERRVDEHLGPRAAEVERWVPSVARVRVHEPTEDGVSRVHHGSAVLVEDGYALTAGHVLEGTADAARIELVLSDGRALDAELVARGESDWALLAAVLPPEEWPARGFADEPVGDVRYVLGYPARRGRGEGGAIALDRPNEHAPLRALRLVCSATDDANELEPFVGCIPIGGMSGGAVLDGAGDLVAVQRAVSDVVQGGEPRTRIDVVPVDDARAVLADRVPR